MTKKKTIFNSPLCCLLRYLVFNTIFWQTEKDESQILMMRSEGIHNKVSPSSNSRDIILTATATTRNQKFRCGRTDKNYIWFNVFSQVSSKSNIRTSVWIQEECPVRSVSSISSACTREWLTLFSAVKTKNVFFTKSFITWRKGLEWIITNQNFGDTTIVTHTHTLIPIPAVTPPFTLLRWSGDYSEDQLKEPMAKFVSLRLLQVE